MGKESAKNKDGQWYAVEKAIVDGERMEMGEVGGQKAILRANLYDKDGNPVRTVVEVPMDETPLEVLESFRRVLNKDNLSPILLVPPQVRYMYLREMSNVEVRRMLDSAREPAPEMPPPEERKILMP